MLSISGQKKANYMNLINNDWVDKMIDMKQRMNSNKIKKNQ
jgi:hypothetical protein